VKVDAKTLLGKFLATGPKATGAKGIGTSAVPERNRTSVIAPPTLADLGLTKKESSEAQLLARVADPVWAKLPKRTGRCAGYGMLSATAFETQGHLDFRGRPGLRSRTLDKSAGSMR
jgi:hypothetical protein